MTTADPWQGIDPHSATGQIHARRADASHPHNFFWARDASGHRLLVYQSAVMDISRKLPNLHGIQIDVTADTLVLRLLQSADLEIFSTLCWSLIERTRAVKPGTDVLDAIIGQLERWQRFLSKSYRGMLNEQAVRGLFCELRFLADELIARSGPAAVRYWRGPDGEPQDFATGTTVFEIKSHLAGSSPVLMISSADQLWHDSGDLYLVSYTIGEAAAATDGALSLAGIVAYIRSLIPDLGQREFFEDRLVQAGYMDHPDYAQPFFITAAPDYYHVGEGFPRITADAIAPGVCKVKYGIEIAACLAFRSEPDWHTLGGALGH